MQYTHETQSLTPSPSLGLAQIDRIEEFYDLNPPISNWQANQRGLINLTFEINSNLFLTLFQGRTSEELEAVAQAVNGMSTAVPITRPRLGRTGYSLELDQGPALLMPRLPGSHYVGLAHTDKYHIPQTMHQVLASFFWKVQKELSSVPDNVKNALKSPSRPTKNTVPETPPDIAEPLTRYAPPADMSLPAYPDLIHDDLERQNILNVSEQITGLTDLDSIRQGDVLYEFGHFVFNLAFCDPKADLSTAVPYIYAMRKAGLIDQSHFESLYSHIYNFAVSDIVDFEDLNADPNLSPERVTDLRLLVRQYEQALFLARKFFLTKLRSDI